MNVSTFDADSQFVLDLKGDLMKTFAARVIGAVCVFGQFGLIGLAYETCNSRAPQEVKYCKDPYTPCARYNTAPAGQDPIWVCPGSYDDSKPIIPGCEDAGCGWFCTSFGNTPCTQVRLCIDDPNMADVQCIDNGANGPPQVTTYYYADDYCIGGCE